MKIADLPFTFDEDVITAWENACPLAELHMALQSGTYSRLH